MTSTGFPFALPEFTIGNEGCPRCGTPARHGVDDVHHLSDDEARAWGAKPGLYHDECCPECNGGFR